MWRLFAAILIAAGTVGFRPTPDSPPPSLRVSVGPHRGVIPAKFANGRPVYLFQAQVATRADDQKDLVVVRDEVLLQAGMSGKIHEKYEQFELRGAIRIDRNGTAFYDVSVVEDGKVVSRSEAHIVISEGPPPRGRMR